MIYPYVFDGVVLRIRALSEPIFRRRGGLTLGEIDSVAEEAREAAMKLRFSRVLGLLLVNRQIHAEVKDVPLNKVIGVITRWSPKPFPKCNSLFFDRLMGLHDEAFGHGRIKHLAIDMDLLHYFVHPALRHKETVRQILSHLISIIVHAREETFFARSDESGRGVFDDLEMPTRPWTLRIGERYSGNLLAQKKEQDPPLSV